MTGFVVCRPRCDSNLAAIGMAALMAGVGEERVFRGGGSGLAYLVPMAVLFGVLHHIRPPLWPVTLWSIWEGFLFVIALLVTGELLAVMVAHALRDAVGFLLLRWHNRPAAVDELPAALAGRRKYISSIPFSREPLASAEA